MDKAAAAIFRFEESAGFKPLKTFHLEQATAFQVLTGARVQATTSLRLKRIALMEGCAYQDARDVLSLLTKHRP